ncbi:MFS transporter [Streptomyces malaysiensis]|uniref:Major facilitator superfamily (MFS) profile domain-containing protein n=1 Tax=Streptomyces malaysiensis TaxID=92644 RepID=A0A7X5X8I1_STRMQ|nr:hypothetical protein [Streptomyces malaysiensis]NIY68522.1 hypothetical protein [Streptomyces malaysiensis]
MIYGLKKTAADNGIGLIPVLSIVAGLAIGAVFVRRQLTRRDAMISPQLFHHRGFGPSIALNALATFAMMGSAYFTTQYLQSVLGKGALEAALWSLAPSVCVGIAGPAAAAAVRRGADRASVIGAGFVTGAIGYGILALAGPDSLWTVLIGAAVLASGIVAVMSLVTDMAIGTVPPERAGSAAALLETGQEFGGAMGMAVLGSVGTAVYRSDVKDSLGGGPPTDGLAHRWAAHRRARPGARDAGRGRRGGGPAEGTGRGPDAGRGARGVHPRNADRVRRRGAGPGGGRGPGPGDAAPGRAHRAHTRGHAPDRRGRDGGGRQGDGGPRDGAEPLSGGTPEGTSPR